MSDATVIEVELLSGRYHAHVWGESQFGMGGPEWPPSSWRLLRALAAAWFCARPHPSSETERDRLLETLGRSGSLELWLPRASFQELRFYQPVRLGASDRVLHHDHFAVPEGGRFWFRFAVALDDDHRALLDSLLARIRYFGRAESRAVMRRAKDMEIPRGVHRVLARNGGAPGPGVVYRRALGTGTAFAAKHLWAVDDEGTEARHPPHLVDALLSKKMPLPRGARWIEYALPISALVHEIRPRPPAVAPVEQLQVAEIQFRLSRRIPIPLRQLVAVSRAFREAAVDAHRRISPACHSRTLTGREADGSIARGHNHAYYLPRFGTSAPTLDEVVVRIPTGTLSRAELDALLGIERIRAGGRAYPITVVCERVVREGPTGGQGSRAKGWRSTTPFIPPLHRRRGRDATAFEEQVARCVERLCGLRPEIVRLTSGLSGLGSAASLRAHEYVGDGGDQNGRHWKLTRRVGFWLDLNFAEPVALDAPLGADAHFGAGQFAAVADADESLAKQVGAGAEVR